jgi:hypothetical protein
VPQELTDTVSGFMGKGTPEQAELEAKQASNLEKYGFTTWYEFCNAQWGTKWDLCDVVVNRIDDNTINIAFDTAWSPPFGAFEKMIEMGYNVRALYSEEQLIWAGIWDNGVDTCYDFDGMDEAYDVLPSELNEAFNIVGRLEEREEEYASFDAETE